MVMRCIGLAEDRKGTQKWYKNDGVQFEIRQGMKEPRKRVQCAGERTELSDNGYAGVGDSNVRRRRITGVRNTLKVWCQGEQR